MQVTKKTFCAYAVHISHVRYCKADTLTNSPHYIPT